MPNRFSNSGFYDRNSHIDFTDKSFDLIFERRDEMKGVLGQFFMKTSADGGADYKMSSFSSVLGLPRKNEDTDDIPNAVSAPGFDATYTFINYRLRVQITDSALAIDRTNGKLLQAASGLAKSAMRKDEYLLVNVFNNGFSAVTTADGVALFSNSHLQENPEVANYDTLGTGALTGSNLQALRLVQMQMTNEIGSPDPVVSKKLLVTINDEQKAKELVGSRKRAEDALNSNTVIIDSLEVVVSPFLTDTDAYFLIGDRTGDQMGLHEITLQEWNIKNNNPSNVDIVLDKRIKAMKVVAAHDARNVAGSQGA